MSRFFKLTSVQSRLGIIFLGFLFLLVLFFLNTFFSLESQNYASTMVNLACRQRLLLQQITGLARDARFDTSGQLALTLQESSDAFEQTLTTLQKGGQVTDPAGRQWMLAPPKNQNTILELDSLSNEWDAFHSDINGIRIRGNGSPTDLGIQDIGLQSFSMIETADRIVRALEEEADQRLIRLRAFQIVFLGAGLILLGIGWRITRQSVVLPLAQLSRSAEQMKAGDMATPIVVQGPQETQAIGEIIDAMRLKVLQSQSNQQHWASALESRVRQRTRELEALALVSREISSHLSIGEVLNSVTKKAQELSGSEVASLCLLDAQGKVLILHATSGPAAAIQESQSSAQGLAVDDVLRQTHAQACGLQDCPGFCQIIGAKYRTSHLAVSLHCKDQVIGALCIGSSQPDAFQEETASVLTQLAGVAAVAIENSRIYQQAEHAATLQERQRMASEMHDGLLQTLSFLGMMVRLAEDQMSQGDHQKALSTLQQIERAEEQAEIEIRRAIVSLQDDFPLNVTLQEQLQVLVAEIARGEHRVRFDTDLVIPLVLARAESEQVLRVAREALLNALRYSQSDMITLMLTQQQNEISLIVQDQGMGFEPETEPNDGRAHFGLKIMHARAVRLGGELSIQSVPGVGTTVQLRWTPVSAALSMQEV